MMPSSANKGFTKWAVSMLQDDPSNTWSAEELAAEALRRDDNFSGAKNPLISLKSTFEKQVRENTLPGVEVVGSHPKRYRWRGGSAGGGSGSSEPLPPPPIQPGGGREYVTVTVGEAQFRGPVTVENLNTCIGILQHMKDKLTA